MLVCCNSVLKLLHWKPRLPERLFFSVGDCLRQGSPGALGLWLREPGASSWTASWSTARTKVCKPITQCAGG